MASHPPQVITFLREERRYLAILVLIFLLGFSLRMVHTARSPHLVNGIDGPYYVSQINYLHETGQALHKDSPLTFYYLLAWRYLTGDTVRAIKLGMSVVTGLICLPIYFLLRQVTRDRNAAIFSAFLGVFNPYLFSMTYNLYKNELGILLMLTFFVFFFRFLSSDGIRDRWKQLLLLMLIFVTIWGTHIMATGMTVLFSGSYLLLAILREREAARRALRLLIVIGIAGGCALLVLAAVFPAAFYKVYKINFLTDMFEDESDAPKFAPGREDVRNPFAVFLLRNLDPVKWFGFPALVGVASLILRAWRGENLPGEIFLISTYISWLVFIQPSVSRELVWRFALASFVPISLVAGYGLSNIKRKVPLLVAILVIAMVLGLSFIEASAVARGSRTTITEGEYMEVVSMADQMPEEYSIVSLGGNPYWYEVVLKKKIIRSHYVDEGGLTTNPVVIIESRRPIPPWSIPREKPWLQRAELIWDSNLLRAYLLPPRPANRAN